MRPVPEILTDEIPPMRPGRLNIYSIADIKRWGVERFLDAVALKEPIPMPDLGFTAAENEAMDEILRQEREAKDQANKMQSHLPTFEMTGPVEFPTLETVKTVEFTQGGKQFRYELPAIGPVVIAGTNGMFRLRKTPKGMILREWFDEQRQKFGQLQTFRPGPSWAHLDAIIHVWKLIPPTYLGSRNGDKKELA